NPKVSDCILEVSEKINQQKPSLGITGKREESLSSSEERDGLFFIKGESKPFMGFLTRKDNLYGLKSESKFEIIAGKKICEREYRENGKLWMESPYLNGKQHGIYKSWYENGQLEKEVKFEEGLQISQNKWSEDGKEIPPEAISDEECCKNMRIILGATEMFNMDSGNGKMLKLDLQQLCPKYLRSIPKCPQKGEYGAENVQKGDVECTVHGSYEKLQKKVDDFNRHK
ncbi:MAG: hypothetical protein HQM09_25305, partial [Candidatus Riflebacteria bacterium]|nr:hypothetical protein [Candidatus Riflebacteria bacterium]